MLSRLIDFAKGSITLDIRGADVERYITACTRKGVAFRNVERMSNEVVRATVGVEGYFAMRRMARRAMCRLRVVKKRGAPFAAGKLQRRGGLLLGAVLCVVAAWYLTGFVWTIEIVGCQNISQLEVLRLLEQNGLKTGVRLSEISPMQIKNSVLLETDVLSFLAVNLLGTHAQVIVRERADVDVQMADDTPCDIVSDKAGVIARLRVMQGTARVAVGQTILPGDIIASGTMTSAPGETRLVHARAEADLRVWVNESRILPRDALAAEETGERTVRRALVLGNRRINLYMIESAPYACYYKEVEKTPLTLGESFRVPVILVTETYIELQTAQTVVDPAFAAQTLENSMRENLTRGHEGELVSFQFEMTGQNGAYVAHVHAECIETAGVERLIK